MTDWQMSRKWCYIIGDKSTDPRPWSLPIVQMKNDVRQRIFHSATNCLPRHPTTFPSKSFLKNASSSIIQRIVVQPMLFRYRWCHITKWTQIYSIYIYRINNVWMKESATGVVDFPIFRFHPVIQCEVTRKRERERKKPFWIWLTAKLLSQNFNKNEQRDEEEKRNDEEESANSILLLLESNECRWINVPYSKISKINNQWAVGANDERARARLRTRIHTSIAYETIDQTILRRPEWKVRQCKNR